MSLADRNGATVLNFADFLEPPRAEPADAPAGEVALEAPDRGGLGAAPAPALGADEAATVLDPEVWFLEAADLDPAEPATVLVPEDVVRVAQELAEEARARHAAGAPVAAPTTAPPVAPPAAPTVEVDLGFFDDDPDDDAALFAGPVARLWRRRRRLALPLATAGALGVLALAAGAWARAAPPAPARPGPTAIAPVAPRRAPAPAAPAPAVPAALARPVVTAATTPPAAAKTPRAATRPPRAHHREGRRHPHLRAPTAGKARTGRAARALRRGRADYDLGDLRGALRWYVRAARLAPRDPDTRFGVALTAYELHYDRTAWRSLEHALRLDPGHADSNLLLGFMLQEAGKDKDAAVHYARYLKAAPDGEWARDVRSTLGQLGE